MYLGRFLLVAASLCSSVEAKGLRDAIPPSIEQSNIENGELVIPLEEPLPTKETPLSFDPNANPRTLAITTKSVWTPTAPAPAPTPTAKNNIFFLKVTTANVVASNVTAPNSTASNATASNATASNTTNFTSVDPPLKVVATNGQPASAFPLSQCQGQCFMDSQCRGGLKCYKLFQVEPSVPGCTGTPQPGLGYCFDPADYPRDTLANTTATLGPRLKMYWRKGYFWQEETFDRRYCMYCNGYCIVRFCNDQVLSRFRFSPYKNVTIISIRGTDQCLERYQTQSIITQKCNSTKPRQWFSGNFFNSTRFEIHPYDMANGCLTQNHHPKIGEVIFVENCTVCRNDTTNLWVRY